MCAPGGPEGARLAAAMAPARERAHLGQGTANRCWFIGGLMVELLWLVDPEEAAAGPAAPLRFAERAAWRTTGASPFGVALRDDGAPPPFRAWEYRPPYLPEGRFIPIADAPVTEPVLFTSPGRSIPEGEVRASVNCEIRMPHWERSSPLAGLEIPGLTLTTGDPLMVVTVEGASTVIDLRPDLPLRIDL